MMFSLSDYRAWARSLLRGRLGSQIVCSVVALAFLALPTAFAQTTSKESEAKATTQTKSGTSSKAKTKSSAGSKSQSGAKTSSRSSAQATSRTANKEKSTASSSEKTESGSTESQSADKEQPKSSEEPKSPSSSEAAEPTISPTPSASADVSSLKPEDLRGFYNNPPEVQQLLTAALELTEQNLTYLYGSADPTRG